MERIRIATIACMCERLERVNRWTWEPTRRRGEKKEGNAFKRTGDQSAAAPATSIEEIGSGERGAKRVCGERGSSHFYDLRARALCLCSSLHPFLAQRSRRCHCQLCGRGRGRTRSIKSKTYFERTPQIEGEGIGRGKGDGGRKGIDWRK